MIPSKNNQLPLSPAHTLTLRLLLLAAGLPPLGYGLCAMFRQGLIVDISKRLSHATVNLSSESGYLLQIVGLYVFLFGALMLSGLFKPQKSRLVVLIGSIVLIARALQRFLLTDTLTHLFGVPPNTNVAHCAYLVVMGILLFVSRPRQG